MKKRALRVFIISFIFIILGIAYGLLYLTTGKGIPCIFYTLTGFLCPGCGVTRMCVSVMQGDIQSAIRYNGMLFFLSPVLCYILGDYMFRYIRTGHWKVLRWQTVVIYIMIGLLVIFGITRNIVRFIK